MTDEHLDDALRDLGAELNVTPSPEFAAKVRARIEQAPARSWRLWAWAGVAATCAVAVVAVAVWRGGPDVGRPFRAGGADGAEAPSHTEASVVAAKPPGGLQPVPVTPTVATHRDAVAPVVRTARNPEPEVLVPTDQLIAIRRLMASVRAGMRVDLPTSPTVIDPETGELIPLKPIEIPLITVDPLPGDPNGRSGGREK